MDITGRSYILITSGSQKVNAKCCQVNERNHDPINNK